MEHGGGGAALDDATGLHDEDVVAEVMHQGEVVADEDQGQAQLVAQAHQEADDLGLERDVEGGDGFVGDDQVGLEGQGAGDGDPLALAAGELVRVLFELCGTEADPVEQGEGGVGEVGRWEAGEA